MSKLSDFIPGYESAAGRRRDSFRVIDENLVEYAGRRFKVAKITTLGVLRNLDNTDKSIKRLRLELEALDD